MIATADLMLYCRAASVDETLVRTLERAAVAAVEEQAGKYFGVSLEIVDVRSWRSWPVELSAEPEASPALVLEHWTGSAWEVVSADHYRIDGALIYGVGTWTPTWPTPHRLRATYTGGYTVDPQDPLVWDAPEDVKQAVRMLTEHWYSNRGAVVVGSINTELRMAVDWLLGAQKRTVT